MEYKQITYEDLIESDVPQAYGEFTKKVKPMTKDQQYVLLFKGAMQAGQAAADTHVPAAMVVGTPTTLFGNDLDYTKPVEVVRGGVCGFAWVHLPKANTSFAKWLKKTGKVTGRSYYGGYDLRCPLMTQSMTTKEAYCSAMAKHLSDNGIDCYMMSRMD